MGDSDNEKKSESRMKKITQMARMEGDNQWNPLIRIICDSDNEKKSESRMRKIAQMARIARR